MEAKGIPSLSHVHHAQVREQTTANLGHPANNPLLLTKKQSQLNRGLNVT